MGSYSFDSAEIKSLGLSQYQLDKLDAFDGKKDQKIKSSVFDMAKAYRNGELASGSETSSTWSKKIGDKYNQLVDIFTKDKDISDSGQTNKITYDDNADGVIDRTAEFEYDADGNVSIAKYDNDNDGELDDAALYEYNSNGLIDSVSKEDNTYKIEYDDSGKACKIIDEEGKEVSDSKSILDQVNNLNELNASQKNKEQITDNNDNKYTLDNNRSIKFSVSGQIKELIDKEDVYKFSYTNNGNIKSIFCEDGILVEVKYSNGHINTVTNGDSTYKIEYDDSGKVCKVTDKDGEEEDIDEFNIINQFNEINDNKGNKEAIASIMKQVNLE